ncbi:MAG: hypothetical protein BVN35_16930 [Proteobacteria bacterium ST_bin11]|jgi:heme-degrading monooxygenase HmoA|nr:MAG: hypothetical protein BVN35_16930 [Proteobacteria bacterium ST_bin11]
MHALAFSETDYSGQRVALLTQHGKETPLREILDRSLGCKLEHISEYDTDQLGTFTRDIARAGNQLEAARIKARIGMALSGLSLGIASEGSFGPDPFAYMLPYNLELLIWIDDRLDIEVVATASGVTNFSHQIVTDWQAAKSFAESAGFPEHYLIVRPGNEQHPEFRKGLSNWDSLRDAVNWALASSAEHQAFIETDMRAFANPTRMQNIRCAAEALMQKLQSQCPACGAPGFAKSGVVRGLPCEDCGQPTEEAKADIHSCVRCEHQTLISRAQAFAMAGSCDYCNP